MEVTRPLRRHPRRRVAALAAFASVLTLAVSVDARAQDDPIDPAELTATALTPVETITGNKTLTSRLAESDPALLGRTDSTPVEVVVKLDYDSVATYQGTIDGLAATSPSVTGEDLTGSTPAEQAYDGYIVDQENAFLDAVADVAPDALVGQSLRNVYGGVALTVPANAVDEILAIPNVVAVQSDTLDQPLTDSSSDFIGADAVYPDLDGMEQAGAGVTVGVLDTGGWPEHPSFADQGNLAPRPGPVLPCNFGDNPLTPASDPFVCTNKLLGGRAFLTTYLSNPARAAAEPYHTARDSNGHGTHTASTAVGNALDSAEVFGVERGPINGIAPGAYLIVYKVCGIQGCFDSDTAAAVDQAVLDGVNVINFSISGGTDPFTDPTELAFLDAYAGGVFVAASAGNDGPGAGTANHLSPWVTTVAASTQRREFQSTLTLTAGNGDSFTTTGASITAGVTSSLPVVLSSAAPYNNPLCNAPAPAGLFAGKIVACQRGVNARVEKGFNVLQGGAAGMILYNPALADIETDNHWLPTVHLADGTDFVAFMNGHAGVTGSFTAGQPADGQGDVMAAFSSRGPAGLLIKPDITAPGVQILAGHTPTPESPIEGPPGEYFQAIAGTSMSSPHIAGSAALVKALHPSWTPGQIKSALMTTATTDVVKEDTVTPADPFDLGAGRVDLEAVERTGLTLDETPARMALLGASPVDAVHLNIPSINAPVLPGKLTTVRTVKNVTQRNVRYDITTDAPAGSTITVSPKKINLKPGESAELVITIQTRAPEGQYFGSINLEAKGHRVADQHLPVAFIPKQGEVALTQTCAPASIVRRTGLAECTVTAVNNGFSPAAVSLTTDVSRELRLVGATGATLNGDRSASRSQTLGPATLGVPSVDPGDSPAGFIPLAAFGVAPRPIGDEDIINFNVPAYRYNGQTYTAIGVNSNGYAVAGGGTSEDNNCCNLPAGPDSAAPNNMLAPFWTDLDGTSDQGIRAATLTDGVSTWLVVEWQVDVFGTNSNRHFQTWIGVNGVQDISFAYDPAALPGDPNGQDFLVGAENARGEGDVFAILPTEDLVVRSTAPAPGGVVSYTLRLRGERVGTGTVTTEMVTARVPGVTVAESAIEVTK